MVFLIYDWGVPIYQPAHLWQTINQKKQSITMSCRGISSLRSEIPNLGRYSIKK